MDKQQVIAPLEKAIATSANPEIVPANSEMPDNIDVFAQRVASLATSSNGE